MTLTTFASQAALKNALLATGMAPGLLTGLNVVLYTNQLVPDPSTQYSDLVLANYAGYAPLVPTWLSPQIRDRDKAAQVLSQVAQFVAGALTTSETIAGYALIQSAPPNNLIALENFPTPIQMLVQGDTLSFVMEVAIGGSGQDNGSVTVLAS